MQDTIANKRFLPATVYYFKEFLGNQNSGAVLLRSQHYSAIFPLALHYFAQSILPDLPKDKI